MIKIIRTFAWVVAAAVGGGCWPYGYEGAQYVHRSDTITLSAGNAKEVNAATQVIDPWPRGVRNPRIPANGERMVGAIQRYQGKQVRGQGQVQPAGVPAPADMSAPGAPPPPSPPIGAAVPTLR
jgi:hypothetical protein